MQVVAQRTEATGHCVPAVNHDSAHAKEGAHPYGIKTFYLDINITPQIVLLDYSEVITPNGYQGEWHALYQNILCKRLWMLI